MARQRREVFGDDYEDALSELREDPEKFAAKPELTQEQRDAVREFIDAGEAFYAAEEAEVAAQGQTEAPPEGQAEEPAYKVGSRVEINGHKYTIEDSDDKDLLLSDGKRIIVWPKQNLDKALSEGNASVMKEEQPQEPTATDESADSKTEEPTYQVGSRIKVNGRVYTVTGIDGDNVKLPRGTVTFNWTKSRLEEDLASGASKVLPEEKVSEPQAETPSEGNAPLQPEENAPESPETYGNDFKERLANIGIIDLRKEDPGFIENNPVNGATYHDVSPLTRRMIMGRLNNALNDPNCTYERFRNSIFFEQNNGERTTAMLPLMSILPKICKAFKDGKLSKEDILEFVKNRFYTPVNDVDNQSNPINNDGTLKVEQLENVSDITDEDFNTPHRNVTLPALPDNVDAAIGANGKPVVIKKNIFERNAKRHPDLLPEQSRQILYDALYRPELYGQNQKSKRPYNWVVIKTADKYGINRIVVIEVNPKKDNIEIVHWYYVGEDGLERIKRQATDEGEQILILPSETEEAGALSGRIPDLPSTDKDTNSSVTPQGNGTETSAMPTDADGNPDFAAATPQQTHSYIYDDPDITPEEGDAFVQNKLAEAEKNLKKVHGKAPKMGTDLRKYKEAKAKHQVDVEAAQRSVDFWNAVKAEHDRTETERLRAEEQQRKEEKRQETGSNIATPAEEAPQPAEEPTTPAATITKQKKAKSKAEEQPKWTVRPENMPEDPAAKKAVELMSAYCQTDEQLFAIDEKLYGIENPNSDEARRLKEEARRLRAHCRQLEAEHETAIDAMNGTQLAAYRKWMIPGDFTDDYYSRNRWEKAKQTAGEVVQGMTPLYKRALQAVRAGDKDALKKQLDKAGKMFSSQTDDVLAAIVENLDHTKKIVKKRGDKEAAELVKKFADRAKSELEKVEQATAAERKQSVDVNKHMPTAEEVAVEEAALEQGLNLIDQHGKPVDQFVVGLAKWANEQGMHIDGTSPETSYEDLYIACEDGFDVMTFVPNSITQGKERNVVIYHPEYNGKALDPHKIYELEAEFNKGRDQKHSAIDWMEIYGESAFYDYKTAKEFQAFVEQRMAVEEGKVQESAPTSPKETTPEPPTEASVNEKLEAFVSTKKGKLVQTSTMGVLSKKARYGNGDKTRAQWVAEQVAAGGELCHVADRGKVYPCIQMPGGKTRFKLLKSEYDFAAHIGAKETADKSLSQEAAQRRARMQRISEMIPHRGLELDYEQMINDLSSKLSLNQQEKEQLQLLQEYRMLAEANNEHHGKQYDIRDGNGNATAGTPENSRQTAGGNAPRLQKTNDNATAASAHERQVDVAYMDAVKRGDMETASRLVHEAAQRAGYDNDESWKLNHRAPNSQDGFSVSMDNISEMLPDIYGPKAYLYYGYDAGSHESIDIIRQARDPESMVTVYRSVPKNVKDSRMRNGDWVTPSREYAQLHGKSNIDGPYRIIEEEVPAKNLYNDGNSVVEWGYDDGSNYVYRNTKNNRKLADAVTYDDNGNIIPPSKRFNARKADERYQRGNGSSTYLTPKETALRDVMADAVSNAGIEVNTDAAEGQRVLDEANEQARMEAHKSEAARKRDEALRKQDLSIATVTGKTEKQVRAERRERERKFREETKVLYDRVLSGNFDEVTLQLIDNFINNVTPQNYYGRPLSKRLPQGVGQTLSERERTNSIDALFSRISESAVGADERSGAEAKRRIEEKKKELLKSWAIATGNWHTDVSDFTDDTRPIGSGKDSVVYHGKDGKSVIKVSSGKDEGKRFRPDMDNVALFNYVFKNSRYDIVGYGEVDGKFVRYLRQPIVDFTGSTPLSVEERVSYMEGVGFKPMNKEKTAFTNGTIVASDIQGNNIVRDKNGNIRVIDADMRLHTKEVGGEYSYLPVETDTEVALPKPREQRVYHGSGADFEAFDHSHMSEGEGSQVFGWGTYVTSSPGIGESYAERNAQEDDPSEYTIEPKNVEIAERVLARYGNIDCSLELSYDGAGGFEIFHIPRTRKVLEQFMDYFRNHEDEFVDDIDDYDLDDKSDRDRFAEAIEDSMFDYANEIASEYDDNWDSTQQRILYTVEIPDDNGSNYLDWEAPTGKELVERIKQELRNNETLNSIYDEPGELEKELDELRPRETFGGTYKKIASLFGGTHGSSKDTSELFNRMGYVGIKYPAGTIHGGAENGDINHVIFNDKDLKITDKVRFFRTPGGEAYGYTANGKIYIDPRIATAETPIHEYTHLWSTALQQNNPKEWQNVVRLMKGTSVWDEVRKNYSELKTDDEIADEVLATYSGRRGAQRLREEMANISQSDASVEEKAQALGALAKVREALRHFWKNVADFLHIHYESPEQVADQVMSDLLNGVNPNAVSKADGRVRTQLTGNGQSNGDDRTLAGIHNITEDKLLKALKLGGLANPSMAVIDTAKNSHDSFGNISLIAPSSLVDRRTGRTAGTWTTDAYTQRYPSVERQMSDKGYETFKSWVDGLEYSPTDKSEIKRQVKDAFESGKDPAWELMYLKEKGIDIKSYSSQADSKWEQLFEEYPSVDDVMKAMDSNPELRNKVSELVWKEVTFPIISSLNHAAQKEIFNETGRMLRHIHPEVVARANEIFNRDYAPKLSDGNGKPKTDVVREELEKQMKLHNDTRRYDFKRSRDKAREYVHEHGLDSDYQAWQTRKLDEFGTKGKLFRGYKDDGTRRYVPETLSNVSKAMREDAEGQTNGSEAVTFGSFVAKFAPCVDTKEEMRSNKGRLDTVHEKADFYEEWKNVYENLIEELGGDPYTREQRLHDIAVQSDPKRYAKKEYGITLSPSFMENLDALKKAIREDMHSGYIETKFDRPVTLDEFAAAVVPSDISADVRKGLEKAGLTLYEYDPQKEGDRKRATDEAMHSDDGILFRKAGNITPDTEIGKFFENESATSADAKHQAAKDVATGLNIGDRVEVRTDTEGMTEQQSGSAGWYDTKTGKIVVVLPNNANAEDVQRTIFHEGVGHYGLRKLVGEDNFNDFLDDTYNRAEKSVREKIDQLAEEKYNGDKRVATEEYMASMAEDGSFMNVENRSLWEKTKQAFKNMLEKLGIKFNVKDGDLQYLLWRSYKNLHEGENPTVFDKAADVDMRRRAKQNNESDDGLMFRGGSSATGDTRGFPFNGRSLSDITKEMEDAQRDKNTKNWRDRCDALATAGEGTLVFGFSSHITNYTPKSEEKEIRAFAA